MKDIHIKDSYNKYALCDLIDFGNYLLSNKRTSLYIEHPAFPNGEQLEERIREVSDADIQNWKEIYKKNDLEKESLLINFLNYFKIVKSLDITQHEMKDIVGRFMYSTTHFEINFVKP